MKLMRLGLPGAERPAVRSDDGTTYDLGALTEDITGAFLAADGIERTREALQHGRLRPLSTTGVRVGPPVARPAAVVCIGQNYAAHAAESGGAPPAEPIVFFKHPNTVVGPHDDVVLPESSGCTDWEVELAVVLGRRASRLGSTTEAFDHIAGYVVGNDLSERNWQLERSGGQWSKGKCAPGFNPLGPWLVAAEDIGDVQALPLRSWVNGQLRQDSTTADMIFGVAHLVWQLSWFMTLEAGDVINTGTPEGVALSGRFPYLSPGDVVETEIAGLGRQRQQVVGTQLEAAR
ncbi:2-keto-4-pentenoate hydratase/2-oxohepta-3-ene-1,7-dioic acid hydratase in catechol pathway [Halopolyspora algeriensis]|uniref:2-keto-4-pentenoate hydratase/2-oxohepta-3-ene-1,7-dioic acid hydratase in catechol pathway n=1 Tax=Halopolyspora algeriensis TaxID=1500506 RepID=A0A368VVE0_9ACTN|nr:fumarylacetoacetate hydrolase family protein [Halopolyspora algeriensis]RCW45813.1 2-keto-4-pentenoate hydratase/2-oxohepta-3-ene-1,7-dioic acid hydratase in catechol pathway [Halopolyspora algeriensis]TQM54197.1 2-keto-4-pentenoate hydratase/2-oxohepta-3-ene-1,7-dioic acid hydratase in catechol pathway [Halopolyspora algeriensis]